MQFRFYFRPDKPLTLPLGYHHTLQGFVYHLILDQNPNFSEFLHQSGYSSERQFKLFCFSLISARSIRVKRPYITFYGDISFELRSPIAEFCRTVLMALTSVYRVELNNQPMTFLKCEVSNRIIEEDELHIRMLSPLTLSTTIYVNDKKKTRYIAPYDDDFPGAFTQNTLNKLASVGIDAYDNDIKISPESENSRDKYVTKFDNRIYITAWKGDYLLSAPPEILTFLYNTGIGSRNSQGFGMFEHI